MPSLRHRLATSLALLALLIGFAVMAAVIAPAAAQKAFPFDAELRLEAKPLPGSKRVPWLQFSPNGVVDIDLWCATGRGQAVIVDNTITIVPTSLRDNQCSQEHLQMDKEFLIGLTQVSAWRWDGFLLVLEGPQVLRWRPASN